MNGAISKIRSKMTKVLESRSTATSSKNKKAAAEGVGMTAAANVLLNINM